LSDFSFKKVVDTQYTSRVKATAPIKEVDAYIFCTSSKYLGERLFPFQLLIKVIYGLWEKYPVSEEEQTVLDIMKNVWQIDWELTKRDPAKFVEILILVLGRRSGKSSLISFIQTYEAYRLICKGDPQAYYNIRRRHPIWIVNCLSANSRVTLPAGNTKRICELESGNSILSKGEKGLQTSTIKHIWESGEKEILEIKTGNRTIESSWKHRFYRLSKGVNPANPRKPEWVEASELCVGDYIGILTDVPEQSGSTLPNGAPATLEIMEQLGLYLGDGSICFCGRAENPTSGVLTIALPDTDTEKQKYMDQAKIAWFSPVKFQDPNFIGVGTHNYFYRVHSTVACNNILQWGFDKGAKTKKLPSWVFGLQDVLKIALLKGVIHSDGHQGTNGITTISLSNEELIRSLRDLCISVGWNVSNVTTFYMRTNYGEGPIWRFTMSKNGTNKEFKNHLICDGLKWTRIREISALGIQKTYDIEVIETHNFFADGIFVHNCAKDGSQAQDPFRLCKDNIRRIPFFEKYVDWSKDNSEELRLFTPADLYENAQIRKYNDARTKGITKKNLLEGSIMVAAFTTSAASKRGKAVICLILDEFAHFERTKTVGGGATEEDILAEMPQTDYAMLKALSPSTKDFIMADKMIFDGKVIMISSPREKGGEFYRNYCLAGGCEQTGGIIEKNDNYLFMQLATWECNPKYPRKVFDSDFKKDPIGANMEYGAHFGEPSTSFIDSEKIDLMVKPGLKMTYIGMWQRQYIISVDPASSSDTYAVGWGHCESDIVVIDGLHGFRPKAVHNKVTGKVIQVPVDAGAVSKFLRALAARLSYQGVLLEIVFDQWNSQESIRLLRNAGYTALETFFTNKYKNMMYTNFLEKLNLGLVHCFSEPPEITFENAPPYMEGWIEQMKLELKYLTKTTTGNIVKYGHADSGPVQTDDFADILANLVYRHGLYQSGDHQIYKDIMKQTGKPVKHQTVGKGQQGRQMPSLFQGGNARSPVQVAMRQVGDRIGRHGRG